MASLVPVEGDPFAQSEPAAAPQRGPTLQPVEGDPFANAAPKNLPDIGQPLIGGGPQISTGTEWGNRAADVAARTAYGAMTNAPGSAAEFAGNVVQPIIHPVETATNFKNLGLGILEKTGIVPGSEHEKYADAVGQFFANRYGSLEAARNTLEHDPVGMAGDLSMLLTGGGGAAARLPGLVGRAGEMAGAAGRVTDPLRPMLAAGQAGAGLAAQGLAHAIGTTTGVGAQPLEVAARAGYQGGEAARAFRENLTGVAPMEQAVNEARGAVAQLRNERGDVYRREMANIGADKTILSWNDVDTALRDMDKVATYKGENLAPRTQAIRTEIRDAIDHWKNLQATEFWTPEGFDALKKQIGDIRDATQPHTQERLVADQAYQAVRGTIAKQAPEYAKVMRGYETASNQIRDIEKTLSLNPNASIDTSLRKLQSSLRDNVNTSFGRRRELANYLVNAGAPHLLERLAGQALGSWIPRGIGRVAVTQAVPAAAAAIGAGAPGAGLSALGTLPLASPRLMGEAAYGAGRGLRGVSRLRPLLPAARPAGVVSGATSPFAQPVNNPYAP